MTDKTAATFRERKSGKKPSTLLNRERMDDGGEQPLEKQKSSSKALLWFLVLVLFAFLTYWGLKTFLTSETDDVANVTPTPELVEDSIVATSTLEDDPVADFSDESYWNLDAKQILATDDTQEFTIKSIVVQPYESYLSFIFELTGGETNDFPRTTADLNNGVFELNFEGISANTSLLEEDETFAINSIVAESITRKTMTDGTDGYVISLVEEQPFAFYSKLNKNSKYVILDVLKGDTQPQVTSVVSPTPLVSVSPSASVTQTPANGFGQSEQTVNGTVSDNSVRIASYRYSDAPDKFSYNLVLEDGVPNAKAVLSGNTLTLTVENVGFDSIVGNGGSGSTNLAETGVRHISSVDITNKDGVSTFIFTLDAARNFKLALTEGESQLTLEIQH